MIKLVNFQIRPYYMITW